MLIIVMFTALFIAVYLWQRLQDEETKRKEAPFCILTEILSAALVAAEIYGRFFT